MGANELLGWVFSVLLLSLRIAPAFAFAPPFSLTRVPALFRVFFALSIAAAAAAANPAAATITDFSATFIVSAALRELGIGIVFALALQLMFGALYMAGRAIDVQAGYGLALLIDPATSNQAPLVGTLFVYAAGAVFFALDGHADLLRIFAASLETVPLGAWETPNSLAPLTGFIAAVFMVAFGLAGGAMLCLFLADLTVAALVRTAPQMNALVLGFQVKTILLLVVLPATFGVAGALLARLAALTLETIPRLI